MSLPIIINIGYNENTEGEISARFEAVEEPKPVRRVTMGGVAYDVAGWDENGACTAYAARVEDSGGGVVALIYGGKHGIRLKKSEDPSPWNLHDKNQTGELFIKVAESCVEYENHATGNSDYV